MADLASFVKDAPAGELEAIRNDINVFTSGNKAVNDKVLAAIAQYNVENLRRVQVGDKVTVLSSYNRLGNDEFFSGDVQFTVDHVSGKVSDKSSGKSPSSTSKQVHEALETYIAAHYGEDTVFDVFDAEDGLAVCISGRKLSPRNFFNGQWIGQYLFKNGKISGEVKVDVHYFEDGNVRLKTGTTVSEAASSAAQLVDVIAKAEEEFEISLNATLVKINENEFKALRRQLPVTRSYMEWDQVATYKVGRELENR